MLALDEAQERGLFGIHGLRDRLLHVATKTVRYSPLYKAETIIASLVMGCAHTKAINDTLGEEEVAANYLGMLRFPDQSQINRYLTRFTAANVEELGEVHAQFLRQQSRARRDTGLRVVDIDQCGLVANGRTYEFHRKGYFPRKRGEEGYQLSLAYIGAYEEVVALHLDPGNTPGQQRLPDLIRAVERLLGPEDTTADIIWRLDAGYDGSATRARLRETPGAVVLKARSATTTTRVALALPLQEWIPVAEAVHGIEIPALDGYRRIVYELHQADGTVEHALLYTTLPAAAWGVARLFAFYNERTTISPPSCTSSPSRTTCSCGSNRRAWPRVRWLPPRPTPSCPIRPVCAPTSTTTDSGTSASCAPTPAHPTGRCCSLRPSHGPLISFNYPCLLLVCTKRR